MFVSYRAQDAALARDAVEALRAADLNPFLDSEIRAGADWSRTIWEALAESRAILLILPPSGPTPTMAIEFGAARAWNKPTYALVTEPASSRLPAAFSEIRLYTPGRLPDIIASIKLAQAPFDDADRTCLAGLYAETGRSVDDLLLDPAGVDSLVDRFARSRGRSIPGDLLLSELLRLRKQGKLRRSPLRRRSRQSIPEAGTA